MRTYFSNAYRPAWAPVEVSPNPAEQEVHEITPQKKKFGHVAAATPFEHRQAFGTATTIHRTK